MSTPTSLNSLITAFLIPRLGGLQVIELYNNVGRQVSANQVQFAYQNWLTLPFAPVYRKNGAFFTPDIIDTVNGVATINTLDPGDEIAADYCFQYFANGDLQNFYMQALAQLNSAPPRSHYTLDDPISGTSFYVNDFHLDYLTNIAYSYCCQRILSDLMSWKANLIWKNPEMFSNFLTQQVMAISQFTQFVNLTIKGRSELSPKSISAGRFQLQSGFSSETQPGAAITGGPR